MNDDLLGQKNTPQEDPAAEDVELIELIDRDLISKLDSIKATGNLSKKYSEIYSGGVYALKARNRRENPDWMSQSANSFREILYILQKLESKEMEKMLNDYFAKSLTPQEINEYRQYLANLYKLFNDITHHFSEVTDLATQKYLINKNLEISVNPLTKEDYLTAIKFYKTYLKLLVVTALEIHTKIDQCVAGNQRDVELVKVFFDNSRDSKIYFLSRIDESWLPWLKDNDFFSDLRKPTEDATKYSYRLPELDYLARMAEKDPKTVKDIINSVPISKATLNPEVIDRFQWIMGFLPAEHIRSLLPKMLRENWVQLMSPFSRSGYEYHRIVEKLIAAKDHDGLVQVAQIIMTPRTQDEINAIERFSISDRLFYLNDITQTEIYNGVLNPESDQKENALKVFLNILSEVVKLGKEREECVFDEAEPFYLPEIDIFELRIDTNKRSHTREDIQNLVAICKVLIEELFNAALGNESESRRLYDTYIVPLPDSYTLYRLRLFAVTRSPELFKKEITELLFRIFNVGERYFEIDGGAEYHRVIIQCFGFLDGEIKREYIKNAFEYFGATLDDADKTKWRHQHGLEIFTYIKKHLNEDEFERSESVFGKFPEDGKLSPHARSSGITSGYVNPRPHVDLANFSVLEIIEHLKNDWSPKILDEQFKHDDFLNPRGAEGMGEGLRTDMKTRLPEYLTHINGFFDRENIDPSYIYSLLRHVDEMLRNKLPLSDEQHTFLIEFFNKIRLSGEAREFERKEGKSYDADWITVHDSMANIILYQLSQIKDSDVFKKNRDTIFAIIKYLLSIKSSPSIEDEKSEDSEPASVAINSVRGEAYRAFVQFTYSEGQKLSDDVKKLYEQVLDEDPSPAVRFTVGQFIASFYYRDEAFIKSLVPKMFPKGEIGKEKLYFATWEGYLASALYKELFTEFEEFYAYAISVTSDKYPERKYLKGLDETLAAHLALAYVQFDLNIEDKLFQDFWKTPSETRHYEFTSFVGKHYLTRSQAGDEWMKENKADKQKIIDFWNWILKTDITLESKTFSGFGFWINADTEVIADNIAVENMATALKKSKGVVDWDYGLLRRIDKFAEINPKKTLEIITSLLILNNDLNPHHRTYFDASDQIKEPLKTIYKNDDLKKPVEELINSLIEKGSSTFWGLKDVLKTT